MEPLLLPRRRSRHSLIAAALCCISLLWVHNTDAAITGASVNLASLNAGVTGNAVVTFTPGQIVPVGGRVTVVFPPTFLIQIGGTQLIDPSGVSSTSTIAMGSNTYTVVVTVVDTAVAAGTPITFTIDGVSNPGDGITSKYTIRTADTFGGTIESTSNIAGSAIALWPFSDAKVTLSTANAGAQQQATVSFTTGVALRFGSVLELQLPSMTSSTFVLSEATITDRAELDASSSITTATMPYLQVTVAGQAVNVGKTISITLDRIYNPAAQALGAFAIRTRHDSGGVMQETTGIVAQNAAGNTITQIVSTVLSSSATVTAASYFAGMPTTYTIRFPNAAYLVTNARITVTFPARFTIAGATLAGISNIPSTGTILTLTGSTARVTLGTGTITAGTNRGFSLANVVNPGTSCDQYVYEYCAPTWEDYAIVVTDAAGQVYEQSAAVPGSPIVKKPMVFGRVRPLLKSPQTPTSAVLNFTTQATIPINGKIEVVFPSGFQVGAVVASGHVGMPPSNNQVTVTDLQVSLAVTAASLPATATLTVTFSAITTPASSATGMYIVRTKNAQGNTIEEHNAVNGEGCLYLNSCNGHGTCSLFSSTCVCDPGWGADTDVTAYRSPDCTLRTCPSAKSWNNVPSDATTSHDVLEECSGMGTCDRSTGRCVCFEGFVGSACQRLTCPNNCRNRGKCVTMRELATLKNGFPLSSSTKYAGAQTTWDEDRVMGCACDSAWAVGNGDGEIQVTEYFGGDCSRRHCPTGDDPETPLVDETNCNGVAAPGGYVVGTTGNICHVECSNRGICNYRSGVCQCFSGFTGFACQRSEVLAKGL